MGHDATFTLVQLRYFAAAAEEGSMTAAAKRLLVSQSAVSTAVNQLEHDLGVQLLIRHHARGLSLTPAGTRFHDQLRDFLAHADQLAEAARGFGASAVGELSVGCFVTLAPFVLPQLLADLSDKHPQLRVSVVEGEIEELQQAVLAGRCELAVLYDIDLAPRLSRELLTVSPPYVIVPPGHRLAGASGVQLAELAHEPLILYDLPHSRDYFRALITGAGVEPLVRHRSSSYETVRSLVAAGQGYSILNQRPVGDTTYGGGAVAALPLLDPVEPLPVVLVHVRDGRLTRRAEAFADRCRARLRPSTDPGSSSP
jgi:DNA-binding transcriptional LysR family regulator